MCGNEKCEETDCYLSFIPRRVYMHITSICPLCIVIGIFPVLALHDVDLPSTSVILSIRLTLSLCEV